jgi:hypothetical protein
VAKRKSISKKVRFEVFKRDSFKCQYCGRSAPDVLLQVDHVSPVSKGGSGDILNLITSCVDCNAGKSDRELSDQTTLAKQREQLEELSHRREQLELMLRWRDGLSKLNEDALNALCTRWSQLVGGYHLNDNGKEKARALLAKFPLANILDAFEVAARQYLEHDDDGKLTHDSVEKAWSRVGGIVRLQGQPEDERQLYYIRGILRRRFSPQPEWRVLKFLRRAYEEGADIEWMKQTAKDCRGWSDFRCQIRGDCGAEF